MMNSKKAIFAAAGIALAGAAYAQNITVNVDGQPMQFTGTSPKMIDGRVLVPLRGVFEELGASVQWNPSSRTIHATRNGQDVMLSIGNRNASVDGKSVYLDVPAMIIGNSTMVPIRFVSEALGADVNWMAAMNQVTINTNGMGMGNQVGMHNGNNGNWNNGSSTINSPAKPLRRVMVTRDTVIPVTLDHTISSRTAHKKDRFTATVNFSGDDYATIPQGTKVEGHVAAVSRMDGKNPGMLELEFDRLRFPNGRSVKIDGDLTSLDSKYATKDGNGIWTATNAGKDQRAVYAGYGAGAGLLVGLLTKKPLEGTILGGALGYLYGQVQHDQKKSADVTLKPGTEFGVRLNNDVAVSWPAGGGR